MLTEMGKRLEVETTIRMVLRLKYKYTGKEFLVYNKHLEFQDRNENVRTLEIIGYKIVFDKEWSKVEFDKPLKENNPGDKPDPDIGFTKTRGKDAFTSFDPIYDIKNIEDFKNWRFEDLYQLGQHGLSGSETSLKKLFQPIPEDPKCSLYRKERGCSARLRYNIHRVHIDK